MTTTPKPDKKSVIDKKRITNRLKHLYNDTNTMVRLYRIEDSKKVPDYVKDLIPTADKEWGHDATVFPCWLYKPIDKETRDNDGNYIDNHYREEQVAVLVKLTSCTPQLIDLLEKKHSKEQLQSLGLDKDLLDKYNSQGIPYQIVEFIQHPKHRIKLSDIETEYVLEEFGDRLRREALKKYYPEKDIEME